MTITIHWSIDWIVGHQIYLQQTNCSSMRFDHELSNCLDWMEIFHLMSLFLLLLLSCFSVNWWRVFCLSILRNVQHPHQNYRIVCNRKYLVISFEFSQPPSRTPFRGYSGKDIKWWHSLPDTLNLGGYNTILFMISMGFCGEIERIRSM